MFGFQTLKHVMKMTRTWDTTMSMIPKGGDAIWGNLDWSPEDGYNCSVKKLKSNDTDTAEKHGNGCLDLSGKGAHYGRILSFGKGVAEAPSSKIERMDFRVNLFTYLSSNTFPQSTYKIFIRFLPSRK